ncbi:MFS transporter [Demequina sp. NBRC 110057]|uniref:MFS transporter n=1 Tax=Demequina sp. NBRC 110057 TaxID=1570346 RepID=UPI001F2D31A7|nr:MFS transporter [Demequina sp. NBRC 110057]
MTRRADWRLVAPAVLMLAWGGNHFTPLLHVYEELGPYAPWQANLLLGMYVVGLIPGLLVAAAVSDRRGRRPVMLAGLASGAAGSLILAAGLHHLALLSLGRALAGIGVGVAMSVGASWIAELSSPRFDPHAGEGARARRGALTLTVGFAVGAAVSGALAQWSDAPALWPYAAHLVGTVAATVLVLRATETVRPEHRATGAWWRDLTVPAAGQRRFLGVVLPAAPWVFAAAGVAYAVMPAVAETSLGNWATLYATVLTVVTLGIGAAVQPFVARLDSRTGGRALPVGLTLMTAGMGLAALAARAADPWLALGVAAVLGAAYGITVVAGLTHVMAIATPDDLAGLTGVYYALSYTGFLLPTVLAASLAAVPYALTLTAVALACAACLAVVTVRVRPWTWSPPAQA